MRWYVENTTEGTGDEFAFMVDADVTPSEKKERFNRLLMSDPEKYHIPIDRFNMEEDEQIRVIKDYLERLLDDKYNSDLDARLGRARAPTPIDVKPEKADVKPDPLPAPVGAPNSGALNKEELIRRLIGMYTANQQSYSKDFIKRLLPSGKHNGMRPSTMNLTDLREYYAEYMMENSRRIPDDIKNFTQSGTGAEELKQVEEAGMSGENIETVLKQKLHKYIPVIAANEIPTLLPYVNSKTKDFSFIINKDPSSLPGSH